MTDSIKPGHGQAPKLSPTTPILSEGETRPGNYQVWRRFGLLAVVIPTVLMTLRFAMLQFEQSHPIYALLTLAVLIGILAGLYPPDDE